jgi:hypothetical protein
MSENTTDSYEVGYGKPPKGTQFRKGVSGNPKGRPRKAPDFDHELLRESRAFVTLNENGCRRRISKHEAVIKQLLNKAMSGNMPALRTYSNLRQAALEKVALLEASQSSDSAKYSDLRRLTDEELDRIIHDGLKKEKEEKEKRHSSNAD